MLESWDDIRIIMVWCHGDGAKGGSNGSCWNGVSAMYTWWEWSQKLRLVTTCQSYGGLGMMGQWLRDKCWRNVNSFSPVGCAYQW